MDSMEIDREANQALSRVLLQRRIGDALTLARNERDSLRISLDHGIALIQRNTVISSYDDIICILSGDCDASEKRPRRKKK